MPSRTAERNTMLGSARDHLEWAEQLLSSAQRPSADDLALVRVRIALAQAWVELGREQTS